jgi:RND superfamily putative drug exporter
MVVFILAISFAILVLVLRSLLLPLKALVMNMLSVGAAYGVLVAVFQWGWLDWTGYDSPGYIGATVPALVLAVTFGLSMDYEVFLLTRIRERYGVSRRNELAVSEGLVASARVITSAAVVMVAVFSAFAISGGIILRELGIGLAVAIALDATLVRLVIVPAAMRLLGDWNWWLPRPLARALPFSGAGDGAASAPSFER